MCSGSDFQTVCRRLCCGTERDHAAAHITSLHVIAAAAAAASVVLPVSRLQRHLTYDCRHVITAVERMMTSLPRDTGVEAITSYDMTSSSSSSSSNPWQFDVAQYKLVVNVYVVTTLCAFGILGNGVHGNRDVTVTVSLVTC